MQVNYTSAVIYNIADVGADQPGYNPAATNSINRNLWPSAIYWNPTVTYDFATGPGRKLQAYVRMMNMFDKDPPIVTTAMFGGGSPYDMLGRRFTVGVRFEH